MMLFGRRLLSSLLSFSSIANCSRLLRAQQQQSATLSRAASSSSSTFRGIARFCDCFTLLPNAIQLHFISFHSNPIQTGAMNGSRVSPSLPRSGSWGGPVPPSSSSSSSSYSRSARKNVASSSSSAAAAKHSSFSSKSFRFFFWLPALIGLDWI